MVSVIRWLSGDLIAESFGKLQIAPGAREVAFGQDVVLQLDSITILQELLEQFGQCSLKHDSFTHSDMLSACMVRSGDPSEAQTAVPD